MRIKILLLYAIVFYNCVTAAHFTKKYNASIVSYSVYDKDSIVETFSIDSLELVKNSCYSTNNYLVNFFDNRNIESFTRYKNNVAAGVQYIWYKNGQIKQKSTLYNGMYVDTLTQWFDNGSIKSINVFDLIGMSNGKSVIFYTNGRIAAETVWKSGKLINATVYSIGGSTVSHLKNGNGIFMSYYFENDSMILESKTNYINGIKEGTEIGFYNNDTAFVVNYKNGIKEGDAVYYIYNAKVVGKYKKGEKNGTFSFYSNDGLCVKVDYYKDGALVSSKLMDLVSDKDAIPWLGDFVLDVKSTSDYIKIMDKYFLDWSKKVMLEENNIETTIITTYPKFDEIKNFDSPKIEKYVDSKFAKLLFSGDFYDFYYPDFYSSRQVYIIRDEKKAIYILINNGKIESIAPEIYDIYISGWYPNSR